jgi:hypothetical protein
MTTKLVVLGLCDISLILFYKTKDPYWFLTSYGSVIKVQVKVKMPYFNFFQHEREHKQITENWIQFKTFKIILLYSQEM